MEIELCGYKVLIDDDDYEKIIGHNWKIAKTNYIKDKKIYFRYNEHDINNKTICIYLHRFILGLTLHDGIITDHINGDTLDNRKSNLRKCSEKQNSMNKKKYKNNKTGYKGVCYDKSRNKYKAQIQLDKKCLYLGRFINPQDAYSAYCDASKKYHGEYGRIE